MKGEDKMFIYVLNEKIWDVNKLLKGIESIDECRYLDDMIVAKEKVSGTWYKCSQSVREDEVEPEWDRVKSWELDKILCGEEVDYIDVDAKVKSFDVSNVEAFEKCNRSYVDDNIHEGFESKDFWRDGFSC